MNTHMIDRLAGPVTIIAAVGCAVVGGLLFAFSTAVMPSLARQPAESAVTTMQSINTLIQNPMFLLLFVGTAVSCVGAAVLSVASGSRGTAVLAIICAVLYVFGTFVLTMAVNVPLNDRLAAMDPSLPATHEFWQEYLSRWTVANHVRSLFAVIASVGLVCAARVTV